MNAQAGFVNLMCAALIQVKFLYPDIFYPIIGMLGFVGFIGMFFLYYFMSGAQLVSKKKYWSKLKTGAEMAAMREEQRTVARLDGMNNRV